MKNFLKLILAVTLVTGIKAQCGKNEEFAECGNICEMNCQDYGIAPSIDPVQNPAQCIRGCACRQGYIRNKFGVCVFDRSNFCKCKQNPCKLKNEVYRRCGGGYCEEFCDGSHCIFPLIAFNPTGCYCRNGFVRENETTRRCITKAQCL